MNLAWYSLEMTKSKSIKIRLNLTLSSVDVAFENLYLKLLEIQTQFKNDPDLIALEQRKHLLRMLYFCSNNICPTNCVPTSQIKQQRADIKNVPLEPPTETHRNASTAQFTKQEPLSGNTTLVDKNSIDGVLLEDGSRKYGSLILKSK